MRDYTAVLKGDRKLGQVSRFIVEGGSPPKWGLDINSSPVWQDLLAQLPPVADFGEPESRVLHVVLMEDPFDLVEWIEGLEKQEGVAAIEYLDDLSKTTKTKKAWQKSWRYFDAGSGAVELDAFGTYLADLPVKSFDSLFRTASIPGTVRNNVLRYFLAHRKDGVLARVSSLMGAWSHRSTETSPIRLLLGLSDAEVEQAIVDELKTEKTPFVRIAIGAALVDHDYDRYADMVLEQTGADASKAWFDGLGDKVVREWITAIGSPAKESVLAVVEDWKDNRLHRDKGLDAARKFLMFVAATLGVESRPIMEAALELPDVELQITGFQGIASFDPGAAHYRERLADQLQQLLADDETVPEWAQSSWMDIDSLKPAIREYWTDLLTDLIPVVASYGESFATELTQLLEHEFTPVRVAAVQALVKAVAPAAAMEIAEQLLTKKKGSTRLSAVRLLIGVESDEAQTRIEAQLAAETDEKVRDEILTALGPVWSKLGRAFTLDDIEQRMERCAKALAKPVAPWLDEASITPLVLRSGETLSPEQLRYLCLRQARAKDMSAEPEAQALFDLLDRDRCGDGALDLLDGFLASDQDAKHKWALAMAGLLGDERVVARLAPVFDTWVQQRRGKFAEIAVGALAHLPGDRPLHLLDKLAQKYRTKQKNIGAAASATFAAAAEVRGMTAEELGDSVVPWLGFRTGEDRIVDAGTKSLRVTIGPELKLRFTDTKSGKIVKSVPKGATPEIKAELKQAAADLREAVKAQVGRHERMLILQRRWPIDQWIELYMHHPVLRVFGERSVWGHYNGTALTMTFRLLDDLTATSADDDEVALPTTGSIGLVHPLEMDMKSRDAWSRHFGDHEIATPFPQLDRGIELPSDAERGERAITNTDGVTMNALTFRGRAERCGWMRGSVVDGGAVSSYYKIYPADDTTAYLLLDQFWVGASYDDEAILGTALFVPAGSVQTGSYVYDEPQNDRDPRVLTFGNVPPIAYSETLTDLRTISGAE